MNSVHSNPAAPLLHELDRIANLAESRRAEEDRETIAQLQREIGELRSAVAYLRAARATIPAALQPVVARAVLETQAV